MVGTKKKTAKPKKTITLAALQKDLNQFKRQTLRVLSELARKQNEHENRIETGERNDAALRIKCNHNQRAAQNLTENYRHTNKRLTEHENSGRHVIPIDSTEPVIELSEDA